MSKDPAFLFYDGDAARDVSHMDRLERGCYFDLIQAQKKFGGYTIEQARKILGKDFELCWPAIELILKNENGIYFIEWMRISIDKRIVYAKKQQKKIKDYWDNIKKGLIPRYNCGTTTVIPYAIENAIENKDKDKEVVGGKGKEGSIVKDILADLNSLLGTSYKSNNKQTTEHINARIKEGFTLEDFKTVNRKKVEEWRHDPKMSKFLRPLTLYSTKFESYLNQKENIEVVIPRKPVT